MSSNASAPKTRLWDPVARRRQEVRAFQDEVLVVAHFLVELPSRHIGGAQAADRAEGRRIPSRIAARSVPDRRSPDDVRVPGARADDRIAPLGILAFHEEPRRDDSRVVGREEFLRPPRIIEAGPVHDVAERVVAFKSPLVRVGHLERVAGGQGVRQLALVALVVHPVVVHDVGEHRGLSRLVVGVSGRAEEPQLVLDDGAAERPFVGRHDDVAARVPEQALFERRQRPPVVVVEGDPAGPAKTVPARPGDDIRHPAGEAAVFRRNRRGRCLGFLDRVFNEEQAFLVAQRLVQHHAVQQEQSLVGRGAGKRHVAARTRARCTGRQQDGTPDIAANRQPVDLLGLVARRRRGRQREVGPRLGGHWHRLGDAGDDKRALSATVSAT